MHASCTIDKRECIQWPLDIVPGPQSGPYLLASNGHWFKVQWVSSCPRKKQCIHMNHWKPEHTRTAQRTRTLLGPPVLGLWFLWKRHLSQQHFAGPIWYRRVWSSAVPSSASRRVTHRSWEAHPDQNSLPYPLKDHIVKTHAVKIDTNIDNLWSQAIDVNGTFTTPCTNITV